MTVNLHTREKILEMAKNNEIGKNAVLAAVLRRPDVALEFRAPVQGYYAGRVSKSVTDAVCIALTHEPLAALREWRDKTL